MHKKKKKKKKMTQQTDRNLVHVQQQINFQIMIFTKTEDFDNY